MQTLSIPAWAKREGVPVSTAYFWAKNGTLPITRKRVVIEEVKSDVTKQNIGQGE